MKGLLFDILRVLLMVAATVLIAGCGEDDLRGVSINDDDTRSNLYIRFRMNLDVDKTSGSRNPAATRDGTPQEETPGTQNENSVNTVDLLVYDADSDKLMDVIFLNESETREISSPEGVCVPLFAKMGQRVRIYAAVNMTESMRSRFIIGSGRDVSYSSVDDDNSYLTVMNKFVPDSDGKQTTLETLEKGGIPMTGQFRLGDTGAGDDVITITGSHYTENSALSVMANVSRLVAKIHVLATPVDAGTPGYARALRSSSETPSDRTDPANWIGWIRLERVRYMPNGINRSTYILPQENLLADAPSGFRDLNMNLESYVSAGEFAVQLWSGDYVYLEGMRLHSANANSVMEFAEAYDERRLALTSGSSDPDRYVRGMYCPENYFDMPADETLFSKAGSVIPMITSVVISARLTPRVLLVESGFKNAMNEFVSDYELNKGNFKLKYQLTDDDFTDADARYWKDTLCERFDNLATDHGCLEFVAANEKEALYIINSSLKMRGLWSSDPLAYESGKFSDGTFYVYDQKYDGVTYAGQRYLCLTAGAVSEADGEYVAVRARSVPHIGGWGYYYSYIDNNGTTDENGRTPYTASQVTRNTYYIVIVNNFGTPGGTVSSPEYIKVNTDKVGWDYAGKGDINLH